MLLSSFFYIIAIKSSDYKTGQRLQVLEMIVDVYIAIYMWNFEQIPGVHLALEHLYRSMFLLMSSAHII